MLCFLLHWLNENPILAPMDPTERRRLESYIARLDRTPNPAALLRYWVGPHDKMVRKRYVGNVADLLEDPRLRITGFSAEQAGLESNRQVDLRVWNAHASELVTEYLLVDDPQPNVYLHDSFSADVEPGLGTLLIDLSAHGRSREDEAVRRILRSR